MKKYIVMLMAIAITQLINAQSLKWVTNESNQSYWPGGAHLQIHDMDFNSSGDAYAISSRFTNLNFGYKIVIDISKFDSTGAKLLTYTFDDDSAQSLNGAAIIMVENSGNVYAAGNSDGSSFLLKLDKDLQIIYKKRYADFVPVNCSMTTNEIYICGNTTAGGLVLKYDKLSGNLIGSNLFANAKINSGLSTASGFVTAGSLYSVNNSDELFVQKLDTQLNPSWTFLYNNTAGNYLDEANELKFTNGKFIVAGNSQNASGMHGVIIKLNTSGSIIWERQLTIANNNYTFNACTIDPANGALYVLANSRRVLKYNSSGVLIYNKLLPQPPSRPMVLNSIANNGVTGTPATSLILTGSLFTKYYKYYNPWQASYIWCKGTQGITTFLNPLNASIQVQDTFYVDNAYPSNSAEYIGFNNSKGKLNSKVSPASFYVLGNGSCSQQSIQWWSQSQQLFCYNLNAIAARSTFTTNPENTINLYPNPAHHTINIQIANEPVTVTIYDVNGRQVSIHQLHAGNNKIDISSFENGIYFARITGLEVNVQTKFIKQ